VAVVQAAAVEELDLMIAARTIAAPVVGIGVASLVGRVAGACLADDSA